MTRIPRDKDNDYSAEAAASRRAFLTEQTGAALTHTARFSVDPDALRGNIENFIGVCQIPLGIGGPVKVNGEHAVGEFMCP